MVHPKRYLTILPILGLTLFLVGCPKRPATPTSAAPPPGTPSATAPSPGGGPGVGGRPGGAGPVASAPSGPGAPGAPRGAQPSPSAQAVTPTPPPPPSQFIVVDALKDIYFDFDKTDIRPGDAKILEANATRLRGNARNLVLIEGHADERGTNEYNLALGERRAKSTMSYLVNLGIAATRITIISYGEERPTCTEKNEGCWAKNRRAHFLSKAQ